MENKKQIKSRMERRDSKKKVVKKKIPKQISLFTLLLGICVIGIILGIYFGIRYIVITLKYKEYTEKMNWYGYNELYNNEKATAVQIVENDELVKVLIGALSNTKDISQIYYLTDKSVEDSLNWFNYSKYIGVNGRINEDNLSATATKLDAAILAVRMLENFLNIKIEPTELKMKESKLNKYTIDEQQIISKAVTLGMLENKNSSLSNKKILKGELNKLVIEIAEKYATMYYDNTNSQNVNIVTEKEKLPQNYMDYPYIVDSISKEIYELEYIKRVQSGFRTPKETYEIMGYLYSQIDGTITKYFNSILNIDYEKISTTNFLNSIGNLVTYKITTEDVKEYVDYVKKHKIKLQGEVTPLIPIMYDDGEEFVVRTKITFNVLNADTNYNLLFGDNNKKVKYNSNEITMYVDLPMGMAFNSNSLFVNINCMANRIVKSTNLVVVEE